MSRTYTPEELREFTGVVVFRKHPEGSRAKGTMAVHAEAKISRVRSAARRRVLYIGDFYGTQEQARALAYRTAQAIAAGEQPPEPAKGHAGFRGEVPEPAR